MFENRLPLKEFDIIPTLTQTTTLTVKIESRKARLSDSHKNNPADDNVWRYIIKGSAKEDNDGLLETNLGPIINVKRGTELKIHWVNQLGKAMPMDGQPNMAGMATGTASQDGPTLVRPPINPLPMNPTVTNMNGMNPSVGVVTHLHGAKVLPDADGWPLEPLSFPGNPYHSYVDPAHPRPPQPFPTARTYCYPNDQRAAMLWFHDHGMDNTAPQVYAGLAGLYFIRDESDDKVFDLIGGQVQGDELMEIPLVIQDRVVDCDFCCVDYWAGIPSHLQDGSITLDRPEFMGDSIFVNGRPWPHHELTQKVYRLRVLNGSNARTYALALINPNPWLASKPTADPKIWYSDLLTVIGNDGGVFAKSQPIKEDGYLVLAPGERLDLLLDLTGVCPDDVPKLRLVNLAVNSLHNDEWPEAIFQLDQSLHFSGIDGLSPSSIYQDINTDKDARLQKNSWLAGFLAIKQANIMQFCIKHLDDVCNCNCVNQDNSQHQALIAKLDTFLFEYSKQDQDFTVHKNVHGNLALAPKPGADIVKNRLVLLMNNTLSAPDNGNAYVYDSAWHDTQMWEMGVVPATPVKNINNQDIATFAIPFAVDLSKENPPAGSPAGDTNYQVMRSTFFDPTLVPLPLIAKDGNLQYAKLAEATIKPKAGTYERWYVANLGNEQKTDQPQQIPDMHPFHMHLVNFVVTRRFVRQPDPNNNNPDNNNVFVQVYPPQNDGFTYQTDNVFDGLVRHDTVSVLSNELLELLVYFPEGYTGHYPYHCHLVEHEDMGMMLHFKVEEKKLP